MNNVPLLSLSIFLPVLGSLVLFFNKSGKKNFAHTTGIVFSGLSLLCMLFVWGRGVGGSFSSVEEVMWIPSLGAAYRVGVDGVNFPAALLTNILFLASLVYSLKIGKRPNSYVAMMLMLETACLGVFLALDLLLFYVFFEITLVGMYFLITGWGHEGRKQAGMMFFIYTLIGSLFLLLALLSVFLHMDPVTFDMREIIAAPPLKGLAAALTFWGFFIAFAIKTPLFPFHSWLPAAHTEAPAAGSAILAGILLKLGAYGFIRFALQMTPDAFRQFAPIIIVIAVISALYGAFAALAQEDIKRMVAYTSVNHMGYFVLGVAAAALLSGEAHNRALDGAVLQLVSHGIVTGSLFLMVGAFQDRAVSRDMGKVKGVIKVAPILGGLFIVGAFASLGLPGLAHFPAEFQIFLGTFSATPVAVGITLPGLIITTALYLRAIQRVFMGNPEGINDPVDLKAGEMWAIIPLIILTILIGIFPSVILNVIHETTKIIGL